MSFISFIKNIFKTNKMIYEEKTIKIRIYSEDHIVKVSPDENILQAALRENLDPMFSCQIGACSSCRAFLLSGKVDMECTDALTEKEIQQGYILTCQSHPLSDDVYVDYDKG